MRCCSWDENLIQILTLLGVLRDKIISISAEDTFDTISEGKIVGNDLKLHQISSIIITTSKFHTRRADYIWKTAYGSELQISTSPAIEGTYDPHGW